MQQAFAYILAFMVILLSVKPGIDAIQFSFESMESCCSISSSDLTANDVGEKENNQEDYGTCNPFQACGSCLLVQLNPPFISLVPVVISTRTFFGYQPSKTSPFISDFWQPPQFV